MTSSAHSPTPEQTPPPSRRSFGALLLLLLVVTPIAIMVASNTDSGIISFAGWDWEAPRWLVLSATFFAGVIGGKLFGWLWRSWRRRRRRVADHRAVARRVTDSQGG